MCCDVFVCVKALAVEAIEKASYSKVVWLLEDAETLSVSVCFEVFQKRAKSQPHVLAFGNQT